MELNERVTMGSAGKDAIQHNRLPDLVLNKLMDWIMDGKLHMGEKLNTEELASQLGVSRMPIREALSNLEKKGLAESIPYAGTRLVRLTKEDVTQIYMARTALEPVVAKCACDKITDEDIRKLKEINEEYKIIMTRDKVEPKEVYRLNRYFHFSIYEISGLEKLCTMIESLWDNLSFFKLIYGQKFVASKEDKTKMIQEHESYLEALERRDGSAIERLLTANLNRRTEDIPYHASAYFEDADI